MPITQLAALQQAARQQHVQQRVADTQQAQQQRMQMGAMQSAFRSAGLSTHLARALPPEQAGQLLMQQQMGQMQGVDPQAMRLQNAGQRLRGTPTAAGAATPQMVPDPRFSQPAGGGQGFVRGPAGVSQFGADGLTFAPAEGVPQRGMGGFAGPGAAGQAAPMVDPQTATRIQEIDNLGLPPQESERAKAMAAGGATMGQILTATRPSTVDEQSRRADMLEREVLRLQRSPESAMFNRDRIAEMQSEVQRLRGGSPDGGPQPGQIVDGWEFRGGDPANPASWRRTQ